MASKRPSPTHSLGILLAGLIQTEQRADRWEIARSPRTRVVLRGPRVVLVPKRWN